MARVKLDKQKVGRSRQQIPTTEQRGRVSVTIDASRQLQNHELMALKNTLKGYECELLKARTERDTWQMAYENLLAWFAAKPVAH